jgi:DNA sulfur modification protein DndB
MGMTTIGAAPSPANGVATFPAIRAMMGDWAYYVTVLKFRDIAARVARTDEVHPNAQLREWIQRKLTPRARLIADYLLLQPQRFFNGIMLGLYGGKPEWFPVEIGESRTLGKAQMADWARESIGLLRLQGGEKIFAIDGQHRVEAIKLAIEQQPSLADEEQCAIFVAHATTDEGRERTRRLFSTLNRYAKPVSKGEIVALDEDDAFVIVTRQLVEDFEPLKGRRVYYGKRTQLPQTEKVAITSILALADLVPIVSLPLGAKKKDRDKLTRLRPPQETLDKIFSENVAFWEALRAHVGEVAAATNAPPDEEVAGRYRRPDGGHLLFRPVAQKPFAAAVRVLVERGKNVDEAVRVLAALDMNLAAEPWRGVFWDRAARRVLLARQPLAMNLMLHLVGEGPFPASYDLETEYRSTLRDEHATLPTPARS